MATEAMDVETPAAPAPPATHALDDTSGVEVDLGALIALDKRVGLQGSDIELARSGLEPLVHEIFKLPSEMTDDGRLVKLPKVTTLLPREKPIPKQRPLTKWEQYAKEKGISKKRRDRLVWDEQMGEYVPRYGKGSKNSLARDIILPHKESLAEGDDPFSAKRREKKERIKKEDKKRRANLGRASNAKARIQPLSALDATNRGASGKRHIPMKELKDGISVLQKSTASAGKFDKKVKNEPKQVQKGKRRKFDSVNDKKGFGKERERAEAVLNRVLLGNKK